MKQVQMLPAIVMLLAGVALQGCSGGGNAAKEIAPGAFVRDEPVQLTQGKQRNSSRCIIDVINQKKQTKKGTWTVKRGDGVSITGWAYGKDGTAAAEQLFVRITGSVQTYYAVTTQRPVRKDVNELLKLPPELNSGFELNATIDRVEPGIYGVAILQALPSGVETCELAVTLIVE